MTLGTISDNHMHCSMQPRTMYHTRKISALLAETREINERRTRAIQAVALSVIATMDRRPAPVWNEIARIERPTRRFELTQEPMRIAAHAGADIDRIADFYVALFMDAISAAPQPVSFDSAMAGIRAIREQSEAVEAQAVAIATNCESAADRSERETREAIGANAFYLAALRRARLTKRIG